MSRTQLLKNLASLNKEHGQRGQMCLSCRNLINEKLQECVVDISGEECEQIGSACLGTTSIVDEMVRVSFEF